MVWPPPYGDDTRKRTSSTELIHIFVGTVLVSLVIGSFFFEPLTLFADIAMNQSDIFLFTLISILAAPAFILHELAHKFVAQKYGFWGEFRLIPFGVVLTIISIVSPFKLVGPGAVMISGANITREKNGRISLAGPITNFVLMGVCLLFVPVIPFTVAFPGSSVQVPFLVVLAQLNAIIAVFNLLPISILDGRKIFSWNKTAWVVSMALSGLFWAITFIGTFSHLVWVLLGISALIVAGLVYWNFFRERKGKEIEIIDASEMPIISQLIRTSSKTTSSESDETKPKSVLVSECEQCGKPVFLPFRCWRCDGFFCYDHRLPENHKCPALEGAK
jgi:Zn-dependent protease